MDNLNEQLKSPETNSLQTNQTNSNCVRASFGIQLQTECKCSQCNCVTTRSEECFYLPLSFSSEVGASKSDASDVEEKAAAKNSIQKMVNSFFEVEKLTSETGNSYFCSKCESLQNASKQIFFTRDESKHINPPEYLVLTLNRFIYTVTDGSVGQNTKIMDQMEYPSVIEVKTHTNRNEVCSFKSCLKFQKDFFRWWIYCLEILRLRDEKLYFWSSSLNLTFKNKKIRYKKITRKNFFKNF